MQWEQITDIILISSIVTLAVFVVIGIVQWITRKSFEKVDRRLRWMPLPLALMAITYFIFDKLLILATRPNGSGEPSFPSTHVMVVATIFFLATMNLPKYVKSKTARIILEIIMIVFISLTCIGRVMSNMHSPLDVIFGLIFAFLFTEVYYQVLKKKKSKKGKNE
ncbi:phosphatase PAP2 family protein [Candidatus Saccharibacteria bacterium]|nr:phosphatase PAP2 family protein [Candidatus Saccharibacteria bacterium]